jgi:copper chaperone NosL
MEGALMPTPNPDAERRRFLVRLSQGLALVVLHPLAALAGEPCDVRHPLAPPDTNFSGQCPNCGMVRSMWARTWKMFDTADGPGQACSFHCLADMAVKAGETPRNIQTALYLDPRRLLPADAAAYVVGSRAAGTMTAASKLAFAGEADARAFAAACGGRVASFDAALAAATAGLAAERPKILANRIAKGKIVEPSDGADRCAVCEMFPARYPRHRCQVHTADKRIFHFCSTRCLFTFLDDPQQVAGVPVSPFLIWVTDTATGIWISARTAYYVVGSRGWGPMGKEAFAFDKRSDAAHYSQNNGGRILGFAAVSPRDISPSP